MIHDSMPDTSEGRERIAVLETKVDQIIEEIKLLRLLLEPMVALYQVGKLVLWIIAALVSYTHWDQIIIFLHNLLDPPKHP